MAEPNRWYVLSKGAEEPQGPYTSEELKALLGAGRLDRAAQVNKAGTNDWISVESVLGVQAESGSTVKEDRGAASGRLQIMGVVLLCLLVLELGGAAYYVVWNANKHEAERRSAFEEAREEDAKRREVERAEERGTLVDLKAVESDCFANNSHASCHVSNFTDRTVIACMQGIVMQKESAGVRLYSMPVCSGPVRPLETREVTSPWQKGRPEDLCNNGRFLDWEKCSFTVVNYAPTK